MNWKEKELNFGVVEEATTVRVVFEGTEDMPEIHKIEAGCKSCTDYKYNPQTRELHVEIKLGLIPVHLRMAGKDQLVTKAVSVRYINGTVDVLKITGYKKKK